METFAKPNVKYQYFGALVANLLMICYGVTVGWTSPNELILTKKNSPLPTGPVNETEFSWIVSLLCIGGAFGNILFGIITEKFGRKWPLMFLSVPMILSWLLILFAQNVYYLYVSRFLGGTLGGAVYMVLPLYLNEIAHDNVRGTIGSMILLNSNIGVLLSFIFGQFCDYFFAPKFVITLSILFIGIFYFVPETPTFLVKQNRIAEATKSIQFYQNTQNTELVQQEISRLKNNLGNAVNDSNKKKNSLKISDFEPMAARKAFVIGIALSALNQFSGCFALMSYSAGIFKEAGSNLEPNMAAIVAGAIQFLGSYVATVFVDRAGRKFLFLVSTIGTATGMICLGVYMNLKANGVDVSAFNVMPIISFSFAIFIANWAILTLPFLVISETMPEKLKEFGISFCMMLVWLFAFVMLKFLPVLKETLEMHGVMYLFAGVCLCSAVFIGFVMPETKGRTYDEIMQLLC